MYTTLFSLLWPRVQFLLAKKAAEYLQQWREKRLNPEEPQSDRPAECPPCPPCPPVETETEGEAGRQNTIWYALSGVILGTAVSLILYLILQEPDSRR